MTLKCQNHIPSTFLIYFVKREFGLLHHFYTSPAINSLVLLEYLFIFAASSPCTSESSILIEYLHASGDRPYDSARSRIRSAQFPQQRPMYWTPILLASSPNFVMSSELHRALSKLLGYRFFPKQI